MRRAALKTEWIAKVDHLVYMQRAYSVVDLNDTQSPGAQAVSVDHQNCRFGKWYDDDEGQETYAHLPVYTKIKDPHTRVHSHVYAVMHSLSQGWETKSDLQKAIYDGFSPAKSASSELVERANTLAEEKTPQ